MSSDQINNVYSKFYTVPCTANQKEEKAKKPTPIQSELKKYTHQDALDFAESTHHSRQLSNNTSPPLQKNTGYSIQEYQCESGIRAYYRVVAKKQDSYVLSACHVNIHGHHRGDLRFIEVNDRTMVRGSEKVCVIGKLFLGDVVAVKEVIRLSHPVIMDVFQTSQEQPCCWMASKITVLPRKILTNVTFSILNQNDDTAVVKAQNELMTIPSGLNLKCGELFYGTAFVPEKITTYFCEGFKSERRNEILSLCSKVHQPPNPLGTIFEVQVSESLTEMFEIGTDAFNKPSKHDTSPSEIVETCILMGFAAANAVSYGRLDTRAFPIQDAKRMGRVVQFYIDNPAEKPSEGKWTVGNRVQIDGATGESPAVIETVLVVNQTLKITARLSKDVPFNIKFDTGLYLVSQREPKDFQILRSGFYKEMPDGSIARRILEALYGGAKIKGSKPWGVQKEYPVEEPIALNKYQSEYVEMLKDRANHPIIVGSSPFGCGKSMTIVTAAFEISQSLPQGRRQLLITQSNFASVNLVEIARKIVENPERMSDKFRFVRFITEKNSKELPDDCLTKYDLPVLAKEVFEKWARGEFQSNKKFKTVRDPHRFTMLNYVLGNKLVQVNELSGEAAIAHAKLQKRSVSSAAVMEAFLAVYDPSLILTTADSLQSLLSSNLLTEKSVATIQIDEASQLPEYSFISLLTRFPHANVGLIGDIQQLPPYCENGLEGKMKEYGIGNTMERAVAKNLFPQAMLREVYRCHPKTTGLLSELFYDGKLIPGIPESKRNEFMLSRPDFWPNPNFPIMAVNNRGRTQRMGTTCGNTDEKEIVKQLLDSLTSNYNGYKLEESDIGVISFYKGQTSMLIDALRGRDVKCGTVDAFQGSEKEVVILCCTNENISEFMQCPKRLNVAMSRAKQVTIIVGNVDGLMKAKYWNTIVERAEQNGCIVEPSAIGKIVASTRPKYLEEVIPTQPRSAEPANSWGEATSSWSQEPEVWEQDNDSWSTGAYNSWSNPTSSDSWSSPDTSNLAQEMESLSVTETRPNKRRPNNRKNNNQEKPREQPQTSNQGYWRLNRQSGNSSDHQVSSGSNGHSHSNNSRYATEEYRSDYQASSRSNGYGRDYKDRSTNRHANKNNQNDTYRRPHYQNGSGRPDNEEYQKDFYRRPQNNNGPRHQTSRWEGEEQGASQNNWSNKRH